MYLDNDKIKDFLGTGSVNADGDNLSAFLEKYDPSKYQNPCNTVDVIIFTYNNDSGENSAKNNEKKITGVLLIKRKNHPSIGWWALPGGFVDFKENIELSAMRELREETGVEDVQICQLGCFGDYDRDPRTRIITTAYVGLVEEGKVKVTAGDDASDAQWFDISDEVIENASDENDIKKLHRLKLTGKRLKNVVTSDILYEKKKNTILPMEKYSVTKRDGLASDHGAIILQGYIYVNEKLNGMESSNG